MIHWKDLNSLDDLNAVSDLSKNQPVLIFKHSTRCSISASTLNRLERNWDEAVVSPIIPYFLDLLKFRTLSNQIASMFKIEHESPQLLLIKNGRVIYHASHMNITFEEIKSALLSAK